MADFDVGPESERILVDFQRSELDLEHTEQFDVDDELPVAD